MPAAVKDKVTTNKGKSLRGDATAHPERPELLISAVNSLREQHDATHLFVFSFFFSLLDFFSKRSPCSCWHDAACRASAGFVRLFGGINTGVGWPVCFVFSLCNVAHYYVHSLCSTENYPNQNLFSTERTKAENKKSSHNCISQMTPQRRSSSAGLRSLQS